MTKKDIIKYWRKVAEDDLEAADTLLKAKKYHHALFFCHLAIEKLIKGLVYKHSNDHPLPIHNLNKLASQAELTLNSQQVAEMKEITSWNIEARYDNIKRQFYKKANREFTGKWYKKTKDLYLWLKNQY